MFLLAGHSLVMAQNKEKEKLAQAEDVDKMGDKYKIVKEETNKTYNNLSVKAEELEDKVLKLEKCQEKSRENVVKNIEHLEKLMEGFPEQMELNEKLLEDIMAKINTVDKKKSAKGLSASRNKKLCKQELRNHMARIKKEYPEKKCFIHGEELCLNGMVFEFSEEKKKLVRRSKSAKIVKTKERSEM